MFDIAAAGDIEAMTGTIAVYDELVALGRADVITEKDDPQPHRQARVPTL